MYLLLMALFVGCSSGAVNEIDNTGNIKTNEITQVLYEYAEDVNMKNYSQAYEKLGADLKNSYSGGDDKAFANIEHMEIKKLVDKTGQQGERGQWIGNPRVFDSMEEYYVFYAEIEYKINNLITSYLKDGINYHKVVIAKEKADSDWKICEMSLVSSRFIQE